MLQDDIRLFSRWSDNNLNTDETCLEIATAWLERFRDASAKSGNPTPLLDSLRAVTKEQLLWVKREGEETAILLSDFELPLEVSRKLCRSSGPFYELARIRFTRMYFEESALLKKMLFMGHPAIQRLMAVPIFTRNEVVGGLAVLGTNGEHYGKYQKMLLSFFSVLLSMLISSEISQRQV
jgi:hypothetical protein